MTVIRARILGFCPGVRRAVRIAEDAAGRAPVRVLGQIVHNRHVSDRLASLGAIEAGRDEILAAPRGTGVVIRSHGAAPDVYDAMRGAGLSVIDATCPKVATNQKKAADASRAGRRVVVAGDKGHGETQAVAAWAPGSVIVSSVAEARELILDGPVTLVAQTTFSEGEYAAIRDALAASGRDLEDLGGICSATRDRQAALRELCDHVDAVVVVGGRNSANTRRLAELARALGKPAWHIESADELPLELAAYGRVGLSAGASTPDEDIVAVEDRLAAMHGNRGGA